MTTTLSSCPRCGALISARIGFGSGAVCDRCNATPASGKSARNNQFAQEIEVYLGIADHVRFVRELIGRAEFGATRKADLLAQLGYINDRAADPRLKLAIVGEFNCGKSTFINALLKRRLLKSANGPTTAAATYLSHGEFLRVEVTFRDGSKCTATERLTRDLYMRLAALRPSIEPDTPLEDLIVRLTSDRVISAWVNRVDVMLPTEGLRDGLMIIDTPGLQASGEQGRLHADVTTRVVRDEADAAIVLIPVDAPMTRSLIDFLQGPAQHFLHRCVFVISKADHAPEDERASIREFVASRLAAIVGRRLEVIESAAATTLPSSRPLPNHLVANWDRWRSRFASMEGQLAGTIVRRRALIVAERLVRLLQDLLQDLQAEIDARRSRLSNEESELKRHSVDRLETALREIAVRCDSRLKRAATTLRATIRDRASVFAVESITDANLLLDTADWGNVADTVKVKIPIAIAERQETFADRTSRALRHFRGEIDEARGLLAAEFESRYKTLRALSLSDQVGHSTAVDLPDSSTQFGKASGFVDSSEAEDLRRGATGAGSLAAAGFVVGGPVGAVIGGLIGLVIGYGWNSNIVAHRRKILDVLEPEIRAHILNCEAEANKSVDAAELAFEIARRQFFEQNLARYGSAVERLRQIHRLRTQALNQAIQQVDRDARELGRRRDLLEAARKRFLVIS